ncbi:type II secretion system protein [Campylobacter geochelonis]|uniref:Prepilin-type N-terminal cleavage/methylation domain-containing protein n=1 Tax=Campylobacter geochelonis TaxID=1780362 RepID=A0A128EG08_9BACT|nr:type II secretion system protein [Campylobacter geochelonis]QKF71006.1 putative type II secretion system protein [Campylobacter geochelonis]CZE47143.1 prepilin-type N-terminal cleavage/methylation domain-containing protein [Campylobacter geochelonis]
MACLKKGFTLIELIMVIVILAILSTFSTDIYSNIYRNYIISKTVNSLETQTELALEQIAARLSDRVNSAIIGKKTRDSNDIVPIVDPNLGKYDILEWIGQSTESRNLTGDIPGWSGFISVNDSFDTRTLITPGSNLPAASTAITSIVGNANNLGVIFAGYDNSSAAGYGFNTTGGRNRVITVSLAGATAATPDVMTIVNPNPVEVIERYYLVHSAYALVPTNLTEYTVNGSNYRFFTLSLYYDYKTWNGQSYTDGKVQPIAENVTLFRFRGNNGSVELKLCMRDPHFSTDSNDFVVCKTKVVF